MYTLHKLINGDPYVSMYYQNAKSIWTEIKNCDCFASVGLLAKELTDRQYQFEKECGGRWLGQEIMATFGIGQFYTLEVGFDAYYEDVIRVYEAFDKSNCSVEVKLWVDKIANIFHLEGVNKINISIFNL